MSQAQSPEVETCSGSLSQEGWQGDCSPSSTAQAGALSAAWPPGQCGGRGLRTGHSCIPWSLSPGKWSGQKLPVAETQAFELPKSSGARRQESEASRPQAEPLPWPQRILSTSIPVGLEVTLTRAELGFPQHDGLRPWPFYLSVSHFPILEKAIV